MIGPPLLLAGSLAGDRYRGTGRVQFRLIDVAVPDQGPAMTRRSLD